MDTARTRLAVAELTAALVLLDDRNSMADLTGIALSLGSVDGRRLTADARPCPAKAAPRLDLLSSLDRGATKNLCLGIQVI